MTVLRLDDITLLLSITNKWSFWFSGERERERGTKSALRSIRFALTTPCAGLRIELSLLHSPQDGILEHWADSARGDSKGVQALASLP